MHPGWKYTAAAAAGAAATINAFRPLARDGGASVPSFVNGWLTSEMPLHAAAMQAGTVAVLAKRHGLKNGPGAAATALGAASVVGLGALHRRSRTAIAVFDEILDPVIEPDSRPSNDSSPGQLLNPFASGRKQFLRDANVAYDTGGKRHLLDVWGPADLASDANAPVLLQVHGGAWMIGNKEEQGRPLMTEMCERGWVCVAINYRLSPKATWPDHVVDVKRAIAWIRENIAAYGGDPDFVAITGGSAGGHLSSLAALSANEPAFQPGFEDVDTTVCAAVPFYGVYDFRNRNGTGREDMKDMLTKYVMKVSENDAPETWDQASSSHWVGDEAPPFLIIHGTNDSLVPVEQARWFASELRERSKEQVLYAELPDAQHAFDVFGSPRTRHTVRAVGRFLDDVRRTRSGKPPNPAVEPTMNSRSLSD